MLAMQGCQRDSLGFLSKLWRSFIRNKEPQQSTYTSSTTCIPLAGTIITSARLLYTKSQLLSSIFTIHRCQKNTVFIALLEAFGVLCLAISKHKQQSLMWTYLNADPQEVSQFYDRVLSYPSQPSLQRLLHLPSSSIIKKAIASGSYKHIDGLSNNIAQIKIEDIINDYQNYGESIVQVAKLYRDQDSVNVRIYNKIKHVFPIVEGRWFNPPLDSRQAAIVIDDKGTIARLPMEQIEVDQEISNTRLVMIAGAELMALYITLYRLGAL